MDSRCLSQRERCESRSPTVGAVAGRLRRYLRCAGIVVVRFMDELIEPETSTRRGLLRAFARTAARRAQEGADIVGPGGLQGLLMGDELASKGAAGEAPPNVPATPTRYPARAPMRAATFNDLLALARAEGLMQRDDELRALARRSLRMTPIEAAHADAWILTKDDWVATGDEVLLALINLSAAGIHGCELPGEGWLGLFVESVDGSAESDARRARGVVLDMPAAVSGAAEPAALHPELVIPRRWHEAVQALDLDDIEAKAYERLRKRVHVLQGVETEADGGPGIAYHRLLGYPNETTGNMPADCVRALRSWSVADGPESDPVDPVLPSREWLLLAQISVGERRRAYVWIRQTDLEAGEFGKLCSFVR